MALRICRMRRVRKSSGPRRAAAEHDTANRGLGAVRALTWLRPQGRACAHVCRATGRGVQSHPRGARGRVCRSCGGRASCLPVVRWRVSELRPQSRVVWSQTRGHRAVHAVTSARCRAMRAVACAGLRGGACSRLREVRGVVYAVAVAGAGRAGGCRLELMRWCGARKSVGYGAVLACIPRRVCRVLRHVRRALCHVRMCAMHCTMCYVMHACALCAMCYVMYVTRGTRACASCVPAQVAAAGAGHNCPPAW